MGEGGGGGGDGRLRENTYPQRTCMLFLLGTLHKFIFFFFKPNCIKKLILSGALFLQIQLETLKYHIKHRNLYYLAYLVVLTYQKALRDTDVPSVSSSSQKKTNK